MIAFPERVRLAVKDDEDALWHCLDKLNSDNNSFQIPVSEAKVRRLIGQATARENGLIGIVDGPDKQIIATVGVYLDTHWFTDSWHLSEVWLFVDPDYRANHLHESLFQFCRWARDSLSAGLAAPMELSINLISQRRLDGKLRLWRRYADLVGGVFILR